MSTSDALEGLVDEAFAGQADGFRPCAFFDDRLDCIRVIARDCSVLEERINERLTVLVDNYPEPGKRKYVGFTVKGAQHFCEEHGLNLAAPVKLAEVADALVHSCPEPAVMMLVDFIARSLIEDDKIEEVEIPDSDPIAA